MVLKKLRRATSILLAGALLFTSVPTSQGTVMAKDEIRGTSDKWKEKEADQLTLRDYATTVTDYESPWNQGPDLFADDDMGSFWNGYGDESLAERDQWIMYDFGTRKAQIKGSSIKFQDDGGGVVTPTNIKIDYLSESGNWVEVTRKGTWTFTKNEVNTYEFETVATSKIRVTMVHALNGSAKIPTAVCDWKLNGDIPADFPKPESVPPEAPSEDLKLMDAAVYASPSSNSTSDWENINGINNKNFEPTSSSMGTGLGWGNWPQSPGAENWIEYDWPQELTTKTFQVYWYGDSGGMKVPEKIRFEYKDADGTWKKADIVSDKRNYSKFNRYNQITIQPVTTKSLRMYMTVPAGGNSSGVYRWKVYSDVSNEFVVSAAGESLVIPEVIDGRVASRIRNKLTLPHTAMNGSVAVSWKSKNPEVVSDDGTITAPAQDTKVTLTATCSMKSDSTKDSGLIQSDKDIEFMVLSDKTTEYAMTIDRKNKGVDISQALYGVFYEDINSSADGGLSAELVKNNSFENYQNLHENTSPKVKGDQKSWKLHWNSSNAANFVVERTAGLNENNKNYAKITGNQKLSNHGFVGRASLDKSAMAIRKDVKYDFSMFMKADEAYAGTVKVKAVDDDGAALTNEVVLDLKKDGAWQKVKASLTGNTTKLGTLVLTIEGAGSSDVIYLDMISLIPTDGYGYGNQNYSYGAGLRKDLVEKLQQLNPGFIRFPGGCVVEGSYGTDGYYNWEDSVGPLEERKAIGSYWGSPGKSVNYHIGEDGYGYMMSYQFGYHEILTLCEDLGTLAFPILSAGIFCQFTGTATESFSGEALKPFADHATHLIDYCWGDPNNTDETQAYWAKKRVANGHEEPFDLQYLGIGNENWDDTKTGVSYQENFKWIKKYVEDYVKEHYGDRKITLISSTGPYYQGSQNSDAWKWINGDMAGETLVDEHYYINYAGDGGNTLLNDDYLYDGYKRPNDGGSNVFVGEYAGHLTSTTENVLDTAISEAAYMTGLERNADIVRHASYAPLFEREGCRDWDYNLIKFNAFESYGTPSYYVQTMYSNNYGKYIIDTTLEKYNHESSGFDKKEGHQTDLYYVTSGDEEYLYTKLVNHADYSKEITLNYPGVKDGTEVELICLSGSAMDMNTIEEQTKVSPVTTKAVINGGSMTYEVPAMSLTVVKVNDSGKKSPTEPDDKDKTASAESVAKLESAVFSAGVSYKEADYTAESWNAFYAALETAKKVMADKNATQAQVDGAQKALTDAIAKLAKKQAQTEQPPAVERLNLTLGLKEKVKIYKKGYTYETSNKKYVTVKKGVIQGVKKGKATVTVKNDKGQVVQIYAVTVKNAPKKISKVTPAKKTLKKGKSVKLKVTLPKGTASRITFTSSNKKVATVDAKGIVKAKKKGKATITVKTFNKKTKKVKITVK